MLMLGKKALVVTAAFASLLMGGCGAPAHESSSGTESWEDFVAGRDLAEKLRTMNPKQEMKLGAETDAALKDPSKKSETGITIVVSSDSVLTGYVSSVGERLAAQAKRRDITYRFQVVKSPEVNAFATTGGYVYVNSGLIAKVHNEAQLAAVMAHEIAHHSNKHGLKAMATRALINGVIDGVEIHGAGGSLAKALAAVSIALPRSREAEFEADRDGFINLRKSGFAATGLKEFLRILLDMYGDGPATILSTHPATKNRIDRLKAMEVPGDATGEGLSTEAFLPMAARAKAETPASR